MDNPVNTVILPDRNDRTILSHSVQDCDALLEKNKVMRDIPKKGDWAWPLAEVPNILIYQWLDEEYRKGNTKLRPHTREFRETVVRKKLQDPNYKYLLV
jgi:hypothetical protein